ncbi:MAG: hypothetical protein IT405_00395 [Candidatus Yanofskybacteria bacterium]|nr:hypothetical protein [Candidatus Yanofskybacteria bacterium]
MTDAKKKKPIPKKPKSTALDAFNAKDAEARKRLAGIFVAFVKLPASRAKKVRGFIFSGYNNSEEAKTYDGRNFEAHIIGSPVMQVDEVETMLKTLGFLWETRVSTKDYHSYSGRLALTSINQATIESSQFPRASAVEAIFLDKRTTNAEVQRALYTGEFFTAPLHAGAPRVFLCGCYDPARRREVESILNGLLRRKVSASGLRAVVRKLRKAAGVRRVVHQSVPIRFSS